jgi:hypothetical protein
LAIAIVAVAVRVVAVLELLEVDGVEHDAEQARLDIGEAAHGVAHLVDRRLEGAHDEDGPVDAGRENERVGDGVDGGRVDDDTVELLAELADDLVHSLAHQQLGGVGRQGPGRQHVEVRHGRGAHRVVDALAE